MQAVGLGVCRLHAYNVSSFNLVRCPIAVGIGPCEEEEYITIASKFCNRAISVGMGPFAERIVGTQRGFLLFVVT